MGLAGGSSGQLVPGSYRPTSGSPEKGASICGSLDVRIIKTLKAFIVPHSIGRLRRSVRKTFFLRPDAQLGLHVLYFQTACAVAEEVPYVSQRVMRKMKLGPSKIVDGLY